MSQFIKPIDYQIERALMLRKNKWDRAYHKAFFKEVSIILDLMHQGIEKTIIVCGNTSYKKMLLLTINLANSLRQSRASTNGKLHAMEFARYFLQETTPRDLMQVFPIDKGSNGDYRTYKKQMDKFRGHGLDTPIKDSLYNLLLGYHNMKINAFFLSMILLLEKYDNDQEQKENAEATFETNLHEIKAILKQLRSGKEG